MSKRKVFTILIVGLTVWSAFQYFCVMPGIGNSILTYEMKGFPIVLTVILFYLYAVWIDKKWLLYISSLIIIGSSVYTYTLFFSLYDPKVMSFGLGFYLYAIATILLVINLFIKNQNKIVTQKIDTEKSVLKSHTQEVSLEHVSGFYIYGITDIKGLKACTVADDKKDQKIIILVADSDKVIRKEFSYKEISNLKIQSRPSLTQDSPFTEDHSTEKLLLMTALLGSTAGILSNMMNSNSDYAKEKVEIKVIYQIEFQYMENQLMKKILIEVNQAPEEIFTHVLKSE